MTVTIWKQAGKQYIMQVPKEHQKYSILKNWKTYAQIIHKGSVENIYFSREFDTQADLYKFCKEQDVKIYYLDEDDNVKKEFN